MTSIKADHFVFHPHKDKLRIYLFTYVDIALESSLVIIILSLLREYLNQHFQTKLLVIEVTQC